MRGAEPAARLARGVAGGEGHRPAGAGGYTVDLAWSDGKLQEAVLRATQPAHCEVRVAGAQALRVNGGAVEVEVEEPGVISFHVQAGGEYRLA